MRKVVPSAAMSVDWSVDSMAVRKVDQLVVLTVDWSVDMMAVR